VKHGGERYIRAFQKDHIQCRHSTLPSWEIGVHQWPPDRRQQISDLLFRNVGRTDALPMVNSMPTAVAASPM
jgi:hypothetical protein